MVERWSSRVVVAGVLSLAFPAFAATATPPGRAPKPARTAPKSAASTAPQEPTAASSPAASPATPAEALPPIPATGNSWDRDRVPTPDGFLVEFWIQVPDDDPEGFRILPDGSWWCFCDGVAAIDPSTGRLMLHEARRQWLPEQPRLSPDEVRRLQAAIRDSGVLALPSAAPIHGGDEEVGAEVRWSFATEGRVKRVRFHPDVDKVAPALRQVGDLVDALLAGARQRWLDARGLGRPPRRE